MKRHQKAFLVAAISLVLLLQSGADEFSEPTHTPTVQILSPSPAECGCVGSPVLVAVAALKAYEIRVRVDEAEVFRVHGGGWGNVSGLGAGRHVVEATILNTGSRDTVHFTMCDLGGECTHPQTALVHAHEALPALDNPLAPRLSLMHHAVFRSFWRWRGVGQDGYLVDWLGVRTRYEWDCITNGGYYTFVPSRRLQCQEYDRGVPAAGDARAPAPYYGFLPPVDDEYPEYVDMLSSVLRSQGRRYVVMELGASFGVWGIRAVAAYRRKYPQGEYHMVAVESALHRYRQLQQNVLANSIDNCTLLHAAVVREGSAPDATYTTGDAKVISLEYLLQQHTHVDYLDLDIQGQELSVLTEPKTAKLLNEKVYAVHVGTHSHYVHQMLKTFFAHEGWVPELDLPYNADMNRCDEIVREHLLQTDEGCVTHTDFGPVYVRDGMLAYFNPAFGAMYA